MEENRIGQWVSEVCRKERLSLRQAGKKVGISHSAIQNIATGTRPSARTLKKLAIAFGGDGDKQRAALLDRLLILAGHKDEVRELTEPMARLMDIVAGFDESQLKIMSRFADFLAQTGKGGVNGNKGRVV